MTTATILHPSVGARRWPFRHQTPHSHSTRPERWALIALGWLLGHLQLDTLEDRVEHVFEAVVHRTLDPV